MEPTSRRFAIFLASGLSLAVIVGLLVWKVSDSGMNLSNRHTEMAGQPLAASEADGTPTRKTAVSSEMSPTAESVQETTGEGDAGNAPSGNGTESTYTGGGGAAYDPLAPRNANLGGARGGSPETSYYRPTNAAPAPQNARTSAPAPTQQPHNTGNAPAEQSTAPRTTATPNSTTVVPHEPQEPQPASEEAANGATPSKQEPQKAVEDTQAAGKQIASQIGENALHAGNAVVDARDDNEGGAPKRPEDPFSASTRNPQAPAEDTNAGRREAAANN